MHSTVSVVSDYLVPMANICLSQSSWMMDFAGDMQKDLKAAKVRKYVKHTKEVSVS